MMAKLGAGETGGDGVAAKTDRIILGHHFLVTARDPVGARGDVDIGVTNEKRFQGRPPVAIGLLLSGAVQGSRRRRRDETTV